MDTVHDATDRARQAAVHYADQAKEKMAPRLEAARAATRQHAPHAPQLPPEARARAEAVRAVLRGDVSPEDVNRLARRRCRRGGRRTALVTGAAIVAVAAAAWLLWNRRSARPEWLTDEPDEIDVVVATANGSRVDATEFTDETRSPGGTSGSGEQG